MQAPYNRSVFGAQTGLGAMDPLALTLDMGAYANRRTNPHAFGAGHQYGALPGMRGLGQQVVVQRAGLGATGESKLPILLGIAAGILIGAAGVKALQL